MRSATLFLFILVCLVTSASAQDDVVWRELDPERVVLLGMKEGEIVIELNPEFAPETVKQFKQLVRDDFYRGLSFYRVIDGFVAQAGLEVEPEDDSLNLPPEFERPRDDELPWAPVQQQDLFAPETGFINGFPAARDATHTWLAHCPGAVAIARGNEATSGGTEFYIVIGQAPRYLDRNLTVFGRVISGMDAVQRIRRGPTDANGIISNDLARSRIGRMRMAADLPREDASQWYVMDTHSGGFAQMMEERRKRDHEWFIHTPPQVLDVCQVPVASRSEKLPKLQRRLESED